MNETITLPAREVPVTENCDVLVVGCGSSGIGAALAAARNGAKTSLIAADFGGVIGMPLLLTKFHDGAGRRIVGGIIYEIAQELLRQGGLGVGQECLEDFAERIDWIGYDGEKLKMIVLEKLLLAGVKLHFHTQVSDVLMDQNRCTGCVTLCKTTRRAIRAKVTIDCTGDGDVLTLAGVPMEYGRKSDNKAQPASMLFSMANVDLNRYVEDREKIGDAWDRYAVTHPVLNPLRGSKIALQWQVPGRSGEVFFNATRILNVNPTNPDNWTASEVLGRKMVMELVTFYREHVPGFEKAYLAKCASCLGIRESRRMVGEYVLTSEDIMSYRKFEDSIACNSYPIDIHSPDDGSTYFPEKEWVPGRYYTIPYRSLVPQKVDGLLAAGRMISATHEAQAAIRVMTCTMSTGQAAGTAAALSVKEKCLPRQLDVGKLQTHLINQKVIVR